MSISIRTKILLGVGIVCVTALLIALMGWILARSIASDYAALLERESSVLTEADDAQIQVTLVSRSLLRHIVMSEAKDKTERETNITTRRAAYLARIGSMKTRDLPVAIAKRVGEIRGACDALDQVTEKVYGLSWKNSTAEAMRVYDVEWMPLLKDIESGLTDIRNELGQMRATEEDRIVTHDVSIGLVMFAVALAGIGGSLWVSWGISQGILANIGELNGVAMRMHHGDLSRPARVTSNDELGRMAESLNAAIGHQQRILKVLNGQARVVTAASGRLSAETAQMTTSAEETAAQSGVAATAAEQVSNNLRTIAASTEEMAASISEISNMASTSSRVAGEADGLVHAANATVSRLGASSQRIGEVAKLITDIAAQTNLLALNATIEAARAGEAGRGFAVVASEVKDLANKTGQAAGDIGRQIVAVQEAAQSAVADIGKITVVIGEISKSQVAVSAAVEEQSATTRETTRSVSDAAKGAADIVGSVSKVSAVAGATKEAAARNSVEVALLAKVAKDLNHTATMDFSGVKQAHLAWASRMREVVIGTSDLKPGQVPDCHVCDLGRWLDGDGSTLYGHRPEMQALLHEHERFHVTMVQLVTRKSSGDVAGARHDLETVEKLSQDVVAKLDGLFGGGPPSASGT